MEISIKAMSLHKSIPEAGCKMNGFWLILPVFLAVSFPVSSHAGATLSDPQDKSVSVTKKQTTPIGTAVTGAGNVTPIVGVASVTQKMSCWQYGKLILEQTVTAPKDKITDLRLLHNPETREQMMLFDFKTAFCIIK